MMKSRAMAIGVVGLGLALSGMGCQSTVHSLMNSPAVRESFVAKARTSCVDAAEKDARVEKTPEMHKKMADYCDCFATSAIGQLSTEELADIGRNGVDKMTPEQSAKMTTAVNTCNAKVFPK